MTKVELYEAVKTLRWQMNLRCKLEGCRYGYEGIDNKPKDHCMWCGEPRQVEFWSEPKEMKDITEAIIKAGELLNKASVPLHDRFVWDGKTNKTIHIK